MVNVVSVRWFFFWPSEMIHFNQHCMSARSLFIGGWEADKHFRDISDMSESVCSKNRLTGQLQSESGKLKYVPTKKDCTCEAKSAEQLWKLHVDCQVVTYAPHLFPFSDCVIFQTFLQASIVETYVLKVRPCGQCSCESPFAKRCLRPRHWLHVTRLHQHRLQLDSRNKRNGWAMQQCSKTTNNEKKQRGSSRQAERGCTSMQRLTFPRVALACKWIRDQDDVHSKWIVIFVTGF